MFSSRVDRHARSDVSTRVVLQHVGGGLRGIKAHCLNITFNIDVFFRPNVPTERPVDGEIIPDVDIVVNDDGDFAEPGALRPRAVHQLSHLPIELFFQRYDQKRAAAAGFLQS